MSRIEGPIQLIGDIQSHAFYLVERRIIDKGFWKLIPKEIRPKVIVDTYSCGPLPFPNIKSAHTAAIMMHLSPHSWTIESFD